MSMLNVAELGRLIQLNTAKIDDYLKSHSLPGPSFDENGPVDLQLKSKDVSEAHFATLEACLQLHDLLLGPQLLLRPTLNCTSLQVIYRYDIPLKVPRNEEISFADLAEACGLPEHDLQRVLRFAMAHHRVFCEKRSGFVSHSAASRLLLEKESARQTLGLQYDEMCQSFARTADALERFPGGKTNETGWCLAHNTDLPQFEYYKSHPEMATRFAHGMSTFSKAIGISLMSLVNGYSWSSIGGSKTVVDVGGSTGFVSQFIAQHCPSLRFVVQDTKMVIENAEREIVLEVRNRVTFMAHDFFTEQPIIADVYLLRNILHDWPDSYALRILQALIPALRPGARVLVNDRLLPAPNTMPLLKERGIRNMDMNMLTLYNSRERGESDWLTLFKGADKRFEVKFLPSQGDMMALIEATWQG